MVEIILHGDTYDEAQEAALKRAQAENRLFVPPFDELKIIEGQATVAAEILEQCSDPIDYIFLGVGGGGLAAGLGSYFKQVSPQTKIIGIEPEGAPAMLHSIQNGDRIKLEKIDSFVDGAAVQQVGKLNFEICKEVIDEVALVHEGKVCQTILDLYNEEAIVAEPAGALSIAVLDQYKTEIKGKRIVCIISGGNNDITRTEEIKERALLYSGRKHYFIIRFPQRAGALREFLNEVLGPNDDITHFEYTKKHNRDSGPALVGLELQDKADYQGLIERLQKAKFEYKAVNGDELLRGMLV